MQQYLKEGTAIICDLPDPQTGKIVQTIVINSITDATREEIALEPTLFSLFLTAGTARVISGYYLQDGTQHGHRRLVPAIMTEWMLQNGRQVSIEEADSFMVRYVARHARTSRARKCFDAIARVFTA